MVTFAQLYLEVLVWFSYQYYCSKFVDTRVTKDLKILETKVRHFHGWTWLQQGEAKGQHSWLFQVINYKYHLLPFALKQCSI